MTRGNLIICIAGLACLAIAAPAQGAVTIGSNLATAGTVNTNCNVPCTTANLALGAGSQAAAGLTSPINGVATSFTVRSGSSGNVALRILRAGPPLTYTGVGTGALSPILTGVTGPIPVSLPIRFGDSIGLDNPNDHLVLGANATATQVYWNMPPLADGTPRAGLAGASLETLVQAVVEPDANCNNLGDETQETGAKAGCLGRVTGAKVKKKKLRIGFACESLNVPCADNRVKLQTAKKIEGKRIGLGKAFFSQSAGSGFTLPVKLSKRARQLFKQVKKVKATATIAAGANKTTQKLSVKG